MKEITFIAEDPDKPNGIILELDGKRYLVNRRSLENGIGIAAYGFPGDLAKVKLEELHD